MGVQSWEGKLLSSRYRVGRMLGRGGVGMVFEATDERLGRRVAVKILPDALAQRRDQLARFRREAKSACSLNHPHIVQVSDFGEDPPHLVMQLLEGRSLASVLQEGRTLSPERAARIAVQIADALAAAHRSGIVHRDLKPANILLRSSAGGEWVTVIDFGVAQVSGDSVTKLTATGDVIGTPAYMAPEQALGGEVEGRADVYALGVVLFAMLAQRLPYDRSEPLAVLRDLRAGRRRTLPELCPDLDVDLVALVEAALATDAAGRPSASELQDELRRWLERRAASKWALPETIQSTSAEDGARKGPRSTPRSRWGQALVGLSLLAGGAVCGALVCGALVVALGLEPQDIVRAGEPAQATPEGERALLPMRPSVLAPALAEATITSGATPEAQHALALARGAVAQCGTTPRAAPRGPVRFRMHAHRATVVGSTRWPPEVSGCVEREIEAALGSVVGDANIEVLVRFSVGAR